MQTLSNLTTLLNLIGISAINKEFAQLLTDIVIATSLERQVNTLLYTDYENGGTAFESANQIISSLSMRFAQPLLHFDASMPLAYFKEHFNAELLTIAKLNGHYEMDQHLLKTLWQRLRLNIQSRLILLFDDSANESYVVRMLKFCLRQSAVNVIALQPFMSVVERSYWTVRIFPKWSVMKANCAAYYENIFHAHLEKMHGQPLRVDATDGLFPQIYNYITPDGSLTTSGYLGRSLAEYSYRHNATLVCPIASVNTINLTTSEIFDNHVGPDSDIGTLLPMQSVGKHFNFSVLFDYTSLCLMVPLEQPLPRSTFYFEIIGTWVMISLCVCLILISWLLGHISRWRIPQHQGPIIDYFVNVSVIQGLFGTPFWMKQRASVMQKVIWLTISLAGIILGTAYSAYLQSFSVDAPIDEPIQTIDDVLKRGIQIAVNKYFIFWIIDKPEFLKYADKFTMINNFTELQLLERKFDTRYAFWVNEIWSIYHEQQNFFSRPLFRLTDICIYKNLPALLPLKENSLLWESLPEFLLKLHGAGLTGHWRRHTFIEFLAVDKIKLEDQNKQPNFIPLQLEDLHLVFLLMGVLIALSIICFVLEIFWRKISKAFRFIAKIQQNIREIKK